jgi:putative cardiolipin synthase
VQLIRQAQHSLDLAYYIWGNDLTGQLMFEELLHAAQRGVRVRLLLDDNNTQGLDPLLLGLSSHPNIEIRVFNPMRIRSPRLLNYLFDFGRTQRRMHGKSFNADGEIMIIGGRNISDPYYRVTSDFFFADLDVMAAGSMLPAMNASFDRFWNDRLAYPVVGFLHASERRQAAALRHMHAVRQDSRAEAYVQAVERNQTLSTWLTGGSLANVSNAESNTLETHAVLVDDLPIKLSRATPFEQTIGAQIRGISGQATQSLDIVSPYFVPEASGTQALIDMARRGVRIRVLTNSLAATDVPALHDFYARRRIDLLKAGVKLYEFKPTANNRPINRWRLREWRGRQSNGSLHAKAISWDGNVSYVGSMNFDPRSLMLNSEVGLMVYGQPAAQQVAAVFNDNILQMAYQVSLTTEGKLQWTERQNNGNIVTYTQEPNAHWKRQAIARWVGWLPIEYLM